MAAVLRSATPDDAAEILAVVRAAYGKWVPVLGREPLPMTVDYGVAVQQHVFTVLVEDDRIVALIETEPRDGHYWIENVAVHPEAQGRGLGRQLLAHAETLARNHGLGEIRLLTNGRMASNRALYATLGYVETLEEPYRESSVVYMSKPLA